MKFGLSPEDQEAQSKSRQELVDIQLALRAVKDCVRLRAKGEKKIPFRTHRLTMFLRNSFGGRSRRLAVVAAVTPGSGHIEAAAATLGVTSAMRGLCASGGTHAARCA